MKIRCIAVDDEPLALHVVEDYAEKIPFLELVKTFDNAMEALDFIKSQKVDLIFLDIQMEELTGIQMLGVMKERPEIIFTTAYESYAIKGFELDVADYLLKPFPFERFLKAVEKVYERLNKNSQPKTNASSQEASSAAQTDDYFFVKSGFKIQRINYRDVLYVEGQKDYLCIVTPKEKIMTLMNFKAMEGILPASNFLRVHKSFIVAIDKMESIEHYRIKIGNALIPVGDMYRKEFNEMLEQKKFIQP
jgi:two-component system, LytTR family, response regulator